MPFCLSKRKWVLRPYVCMVLFPCMQLTRSPFLVAHVDFIYSHLIM